MLRALLLRPARRMKRVRQKQQSRDQFGLFCAKHAGLAPTVRMASKEQLAAREISQCCHSILQASAIAGRIRWAGRAERSDLPEREITAKNGVPTFGEGVR